MVDRANCQIALQFFERLLHLGQLEIERPKLRRVTAAQIRPQQITSIAAASLAQVLPVQVKRNVSGVTIWSFSGNLSSMIRKTAGPASFRALPA